MNEYEKELERVNVGNLIRGRSDGFGVGEDNAYVQWTAARRAKYPVDLLGDMVRGRNDGLGVDEVLEKCRSLRSNRRCED